MLDAEQQQVLAQAIRRLAEADRAKLDVLRQEVRALRNSVRPIQPRTVTAISLMATDAGENVVQFAPYLIVPVRVVDSLASLIFWMCFHPPWTSVSWMNCSLSGRPLSQS